MASSGQSNNMYHPLRGATTMCEEVIEIKTKRKSQSWFHQIRNDRQNVFLYVTVQLSQLYLLQFKKYVISKSKHIYLKQPYLKQEDKTESKIIKLMAAFFVFVSNALGLIFLM